jgi:maltooligosyltrehalose trehalohydrolase
MMPASSKPWTPRLGAWPADDGFRCRVWAPERERVDVVLHPRSELERQVPLERTSDGYHGGRLDAAAGMRYAYLLDGEGPFPDPASRYQPEGVHGSSALVDPRPFVWSDSSWQGRRIDDLVIYEIHVGAFSPEGTYAGIINRLGYLSQLGVTAIELMPLAQFSGRRNWGYDGVDLFAPARCYGTPDDLRRLVDAAHRAGLAVLLDVVYNHLGPDGAYLSKFSPYYFSDTHHTPWGQAINLDGAHAAHVRSFFIDNALHWIHEYHVDGLRLDATHALIDDSPRHFLAELAERVHGSAGARTVLLIAEDNRNLAAVITSPSAGGWGLDAVWADDFHHHARRLVAGDADGCFQDFSGATGDLAATLRRGWFYTGQSSAYRRRQRGTDPAGVPVERIIIYLQNHDQIGNRAFGDRLHHNIDPAVFRALSALLLLAPETPLLFMGQEWAAGSPFLYFTDHRSELGALVAEGRRAEFSRFTAFADPCGREDIPDPQADATFVGSILDWQERLREPHSAVERLYRALIGLRRHDAALAASTSGCSFEVEAFDVDTIGLVRKAAGAAELLLIVRLRGAGTLVAGAWKAIDPGAKWQLVMTTEDARYAEAPMPPVIDTTAARLTLRFPRPAAVILRSSR